MHEALIRMRSVSELELKQFSAVWIATNSRFTDQDAGFASIVGVRLEGGAVCLQG